MRTQLENNLIEIAQNWRKSGQHQSTISSDNTPFTDIGINGIKARATYSQGTWIFKAIARSGFTGEECYSLEESIYMKQ